MDGIDPPLPHNFSLIRLSHPPLAMDSPANASASQSIAGGWEANIGGWGEIEMRVGKFHTIACPDLLDRWIDSPVPYRNL